MFTSAICRTGLCVWLCRLAIIGCGCACSKSNEVEREVQDKEIHIALGAPIEMSPQLPFAIRNENDGLLYLDTQRMVVLKFPSGKVWRRSSELTIVDEREGIISEVTTTPLNRSETFNGALRVLMSDSEDLRTPDDPQFLAKMARLESAPPSWGPFESQSTAFDVEPGVSFFAEIKPTRVPEEWFLSYTFTAKSSNNKLPSDNRVGE